MSTITGHSSTRTDADPDPQEGIDRLYRRLAARPDGLSPREAERRLIQYGPNPVQRSGGSRWGMDLVGQLIHPLALLLWLAAALPRPAHLLRTDRLGLG